MRDMLRIVWFALKINVGALLMGSLYILGFLVPFVLAIGAIILVARWML